MRNYLIEGISGSGKSTVGDELLRRGYKVVEADWEPGLSQWVEKETGHPAKHEPPFSEEWLAKHIWVWNEEKLNQMLDEEQDGIQFLVGGADNMEKFFSKFTKRFFLYVDNELMKRRLQNREPERWPDESAELRRMTEWNNGLLSNPPKNVILIEGSQPVNKIADIILGEVNE